MKHITLAIVVLFSFSSNAQDQKGVSLKLYSQFNHFEASVFYPSTNNISVTYSFTNTRLNVSPAVRLSLASGYSHEWALTSFRMNNFEEVSVVNANNINIPVGCSDVREFDIGFRYEFSRRFTLFRDESSFDFDLGIAVSPNISVVSTTFCTSNRFSEKETAYLLDILMIPRLIYSFDNKWFIDLNTGQRKNLGTRQII